MGIETKIVNIGQAARYFGKTVDDSVKNKALTLKQLKKLCDKYFGTGNFSKGPSARTTDPSQLDNRVVKMSQFKKAVYPYDELEYIESTGSQYINTNYFPKKNTRIVFDVQAMDLNGDWLTFYGCRSGSFDQEFALYSNNKTRYRSNFGPDLGIYGGTPTTERILVDQTGPQLKINDAVIITHPQTDLNSQDALFLLAVNTHGRIEYPIKARIYSCKIYTGETLSLDLIPVRRKENGEIGLLDRVNNVFYKNYTTGSFIGGPIKDYVPSTYTRLEYLKSSGTQYILTDYYPNQDTQVDCDFWVDSIYSGVDENYQPVFGAAVQYNEQAFEFWSQAYGFTTYDNQEFISNTGVVAQKVNHVSKNKNVVTVNNGQSVSFTYVPFTSPLPMMLFGTNRKLQGIITSTQGSNLRIYSLEIKENDARLYNFIPVKRISDGELGFYETVTNSFYTNNGTGSFIAGPEVG